MEEVVTVTEGKQEFANERDILQNTLTKCSDCKLRWKCQHTKELREQYKLLIKESDEAFNNRIREHPGDNMHASDMRIAAEKAILELNIAFDDDASKLQCLFEKQDVIENLTLLQKRYDFSDPRVYMVVKEMIRQSIMDFRAHKLSISSEIMQKIYTKNGSYEEINPVHMFKMKSGEHMTGLIKTLDGILKGDVIVDAVSTTSKARIFTDFISKINFVEDRK